MEYGTQKLSLLHVYVWCLKFASDGPSRAPQPVSPSLQKKLDGAGVYEYLVCVCVLGGMVYANAIRK